MSCSTSQTKISLFVGSVLHAQFLEYEILYMCNSRLRLIRSCLIVIAIEVMWCNTFFLCVEI